MGGVGNLSVYMRGEVRALCAALCARVLTVGLNLHVFSSAQTGFQNNTELGRPQVRPRVLSYPNPLCIKCTRLAALALPETLFHHNCVYMTTVHASKVSSHVTSVSCSHA